MTDRREAVARAIYGAEQAMYAKEAGIEESAEYLARDLDAHSMRDPDFNHYWMYADAALAAIAASEPTEADVLAQALADEDAYYLFRQHFTTLDMCREILLVDDMAFRAPSDTTMAALRAFVAATRKAGQA